MAGPIRIIGLPRPQPAVEMRPGADIGRSGQAQGASKPFTEFLAEQVEAVNGTQIEADKVVSSFTTGRSGNLHEMMIALDKADVTFRMLTRVRNKVLDAYQEIMRMSV